MLTKFLKMVWIVLETQLLLRVHKAIAFLILVSPIIAFVLIVQFYAASRLPPWAVPIIYIATGVLIAGLWIRKLFRSKKLSRTG